MRFRRVEAAILASVLLASSLAPVSTTLAVEQTSTIEENGPFYTYTNEVKNSSDATEQRMLLDTIQSITTTRA